LILSTPPGNIDYQYFLGNIDIKTYPKLPPTRNIGNCLNGQRMQQYMASIWHPKFAPRTPRTNVLVTEPMCEPSIALPIFCMGCQMKGEGLTFVWQVATQPPRGQTWLTPTAASKLGQLATLVTWNRERDLTLLT
jgi:hypothetical protein